jgi:arylamine N-acetyltransferase
VDGHVTAERDTSVAPADASDSSVTFDLAGYFDPIGYAGPAEPTLERLSALAAAHNRSIPFENLDLLLGTPVFGLSAAAVAAKLVHRRILLRAMA